MTTLAELVKDLPWGLHDAHLEGLSIDWLAQAVTLVVRFPMTERQDVERRAEGRVSGLFFCAVDPPLLTAGQDLGDSSQGLWIDGGEGPAQGVTGLPALPPDVFLHHIYVSNWNYRAIHIAGRDAQLRWLDEEAPRKGPGGALFPGDELPDP